MDDDARRYRANAAECFSAAQRCEPSYRGLTLAIAATWTSLALQQETMDELLAIWSRASPATLPDRSRQRFRYPSDLYRPSFPASARGIIALSEQLCRAVPRSRTTHAQPHEGMAMSAFDAFSRALVFLMCGVAITSIAVTGYQAAHVFGMFW